MYPLPDLHAKVRMYHVSGYLILSFTCNYVPLSHTRTPHTVHHARTNRMRSERVTMGAIAARHVRAVGAASSASAIEGSDLFTAQTHHPNSSPPTTRAIAKNGSIGLDCITLSRRTGLAPTSAVSRARCQSSRSSSAAASQRGTISQRPQAEELCGALRPCSQEPRRVRPRAASLPS